MSASAKKKLRKEENAAQLTEKQQIEQKEAKKLKAYTTVFIVAIVAVLVAGLVFGGINFVKSSGIVEKNTVVATINEYELNAIEANYYYMDLINGNMNSWSSTYGESMQFYLSMMGLDITQPLSAQQYAEGQSWADYFVESAINSAKSDYLLAEKAKAEGFTMSEDSVAMIDQTISNLSLYASLYGYSDVDSYMRNVYGPGASEESYRTYMEKAMLATDYYNAYSENLVFDDAQLREYEADRYDEYSSFDYASYSVSYYDYLTGGTTDENGSITYSDAEREAAREAAKAAAESLPVCSTVDELNTAIAALPANESAQDACITHTNTLYSSIASNIRSWLADSSRKEGDFTVIPLEGTTYTEDGEELSVVNEYSVVLYLGRNDNKTPLANVRHILFSFNGGTTDENGNVTYSDEEKAAALAEAEAALEMYKMGELSDANFAALATANTDDTASAATGGLYEDITPQQGIYEENFTNWATDPAREAGDTGIIETSYGYHVMYYVGDDEVTYRDYMISNELSIEAIAEWFDNIISAATVETKDTSRINKDLVLSAAQ